MLNFYDFEVFKHDNLVVIINPIDKTKEVLWNDKIGLRHYYNKHKDEIWIGFNSRNYDQYILQGILCDFNPKEISDFILAGKKGWQFSNLLRNYPLINFDVMTGFNGLKTLEAFMGNSIQESKVPFDIDRHLTPEERDEVEQYCTHDVEQTIEVFLQRKVEFDSQLALIKMFKKPITFMSKTQAQLAASILNARKVETFDEWAIRLPDTLVLNKYRRVAEWFLQDANHDTEAKLETDIAGVPHVFAWGGVHGAIRRYLYECKDDELFVMADVSQLYPYLMWRYKLLSRGCDKQAYATLKDTIDTSIRLKNEGKKAEREPYKRFNNIIYGAMGDKTNPMYDPLHRNLVCVFGQVLILDLIEKIESFTELIQSNTDGILVKIKRADFEKFDDVVYAWEQRTGLSMTFDIYKKIYQGDVNNYVVIDHEGKYKSKGGYVKKLNDLDYDLPIVNRAIVDYLVAGIPPATTINECDVLRDFQKVVKISGKYAFAVFRGQKMTDKTFRVFADKRETASYIGKCKKEGATVEKFANTPDRAFKFNSSVEGMRPPQYLDRQWYIDLAIKRLDEKFGVKVED